MVQHSQRLHIAHLTVCGYALVIWFFLALGGSLQGTFVSSPSRPPFLLGTAIVLPVVLFILAYAWFAGVRHFVSSLPVSIITTVQIYRVLGVVMLIMYLRGGLPGLFALPAGWGDIAVGMTAPLAALAQSSKNRLWQGTFITWNILGMLDLVMAVSLGVLASPSRLGILAGTPTTVAMAIFPLSLIPTFLVPLSFIFHLIGLSHARQR